MSKSAQAADLIAAAKSEKRIPPELRRELAKLLKHNDSVAYKDRVRRSKVIKELCAPYGITGEGAFDRSPAGLGAEDFAYMCQQAPGAMLMLGAAIGDGARRGHHTPVFDIDERCLPVGSAILAETALRFLKGDVGL